MLAGSESDLQRMMDRLNMLTVNYNMKINTKKTKVLRVSNESESDNEDSIVAGEIIEQVKEFCYFGSMISDDATEKSREGYSNSGVNLVSNLGVVDPGKQNRFLQANFRKISIFLVNFTKEYRVLQENFRIFYFFRQLKKLIFQ